MRSKKWKKKKSKTAKSLARDGSNTLGNKRPIYHSDVLLNFRNPEASPNPANHGYTKANGLCLPIMSTKPPLLDELVKVLCLTTSQTGKVMIQILTIALSLVMKKLSMD